MRIGPKNIKTHHDQPKNLLCSPKTNIPREDQLQNLPDWLKNLLCSPNPRISPEGAGAAPSQSEQSQSRNPPQSRDLGWGSPIPLPLWDPRVPAGIWNRVRHLSHDGAPGSPQGLGMGSQGSLQRFGMGSQGPNKGLGWVPHLSHDGVPTGIWDGDPPTPLS